MWTGISCLTSDKAAGTRYLTQCSRLIWSRGLICRLTMWIWILLWARFSPYCQLSVTNPEWQLLRSGEDRTMLPGWLAGSPVQTIYGEAERSWVMERRAQGRGDRHFITNNIILNARYTHMMCHAGPDGFSSYMKEFIGYRWWCNALFMFIFHKLDRMYLCSVISSS